MKDSQRAYNYAAALFSIANEKKIAQEISEKLTLFAQIFTSDKRLVKFFNNPTISFNAKKDVLTNIFKLKPLALHFLFLLARNKALDILPEIVISYKDLMDNSQNIEQVKVTSASALEKEKQDALKQKLDTVLKKETSCTFEIDPGLIAGFTIEYGDNLIDGSMKRQLKTLKESLSSI